MFVKHSTGIDRVISSWFTKVMAKRENCYELYLLVLRIPITLPPLILPALPA